MERKIYLGLFILAVVVFTPYLLREDLVGYDSYAFHNEICGLNHKNVVNNLLTPLSTIIFDIIPCSIPIMKLTLFFVFFSSVIITAKTGEIVNKKNGWLAGLFMFLAFITIQNFVKLENDPFSLPLIFLSYYFLLKAEKETEKPEWLGIQTIFYSRKLWYQIIALLCLGIGVLIWGAAGLVIFGVGLMHYGFFIVAIPVIAAYGKELFAAVASSPIIIENIPVRGMIGLLILNYAFLTPVLAPLTYFLGFMALLNSKFAILVVPLLAVGCVNLFNHIKLENLRVFFVTMSIVLAVGSGILVLFFAPPTPTDWESVDYSLELHNSTGKPIKNEFWLGYMLESKGYEPEFFGWYDPDYLLNTKGWIIITDQILNCPYENFNDLNVYSC